MSLFPIRASSPDVAVEIAGHGVSAAAIEMRGSQAVVAAHASEPVPPGVLAPSLNAVNILDRAALVGALGRMFDRLGRRPRRIGLVVPDATARVSLVRFEKVPARSHELDQLIRWQVRKAAPFPIEEAQVSFVPGVKTPEGQEFIVSLARRSVVEEYEGVCADLGCHAGIVDLATFNLVNAVLAGELAPSGDWLLVNVATDSASIAILRGAHLIFFRNRAADTDGHIADLVHQTAMYYEDRLSGSGFSRVVLAGAAASPNATDVEAIRQSLAERLSAPVAPVDPRNAAALTDRIAASPALLDTLAPLVGLLLRDREVRVG